MSQVQCFSCGFLVLMSKRQDLIFESADHVYRTSGHPSASREAVVHHRPQCYRGKWNLHGETEQEPQESGVEHWYYQQNDTVIHRVRDCDEWIRWEPDYSPKEHLEERKMQEVREWQAARDREDRDFRAEQRRLDQEWRTLERQWRTNQEKRREGQHTTTLWVIGVLATLAIVAGCHNSRRVHRKRRASTD